MTDKHAQTHSNDDVESGYGGFSLANMLLALPVTALREVVSCSLLQPLPCATVGIIGGLDFRGVLLPILDLRILLGHEITPIKHPCVLIMVHDGKIVGILADTVSGLFSSYAGKINRNASNSSTSLFYATVKRADEDTQYSVLSPEAICCLPELPMLVDPEPQRQLLSIALYADASIETIETSPVDTSKTVILLRCGRLHLAIESDHVQATISNPQIEPSALAMGSCKGLITYAGKRIPVVDLHHLCGFDALDYTIDPHAFVLNLEQGQVAFLVHAVVDVICVNTAEIIPIPAFALPQPTLFRGALKSTLAHPQTTSTDSVNNYLLINANALIHWPEATSLATASLERSGMTDNLVNHAARNGVKKTSNPILRSLVVYDAGGDCVTPLEQIAMILPYSSDIAIFGEEGILFGFIENRARSIPVLCLQHITGKSRFTAALKSCILVIESGNDLIGFVIPELKSIETTLWEPEIAALNASSGSEQSHKFALIGTPAAQRMLPIRDLTLLAMRVSNPNEHSLIR